MCTSKCMYVCVILGRCVFVWVCVCVWVCVGVCVWWGGRGGGSGVSLWVVTCLCPIHVAFCQVLTNAFVVLPIVRLSCEFHFLCAILISLTMPIKGNVFEKKKRKKKKKENLSFFSWLPYYLPFPVMNVPSSSAVVPLSVSAAE